MPKRQASHDVSNAAVEQPQIIFQGPTQPVCPVGLIWDRINYSCAYDAFFTPLACLWSENPQLWSERLMNFSPAVQLWATAMEENTSSSPEVARDVVREFLHFENAAAFPQGPRRINLDTLFMAVTDRRSHGSAVTYCELCGYREPGMVQTFGHYLDV